MAKYELAKTVEATKLNQRTGIPLTEPPIPLPFGAIIDNVEESGDYYKFEYLMQRYQVKKDAVAGALHAVGEAPALGGTAGEAAAETIADSRPLLAFQPLRSRGVSGIFRAKIAGGWLVVNNSGVAFVPDPGHTWDGGSLE